MYAVTVVGIVAGIAVGVVVIITLVIVCCVCVCCKKVKEKEMCAPSSPPLIDL